MNDPSSCETKNQTLLFSFFFFLVILFKHEQSHNLFFFTNKKTKNFHYMICALFVLVKQL